MGSEIRKAKQISKVRKPPAVFLSGPRVDLCVLDPYGDLREYQAWINDQETTRYLAAGKYPLTKNGIREHIKQFKNTKDILLGVFLRATGQHIGNIALRHRDDRNRNADIGLLIGNKNFRGQGLGHETLKLVVEYAFSSLNLHRVFAGIVESNVASIRLFEGLGFKREGLLKEHFYLEGKYENFLMYGLLRTEYIK